MERENKYQIQLVTNCVVSITCGVMSSEKLSRALVIKLLLILSLLFLFPLEESIALNK